MNYIYSLHSNNSTVSDNASEVGKGIANLWPYPPNRHWISRPDDVIPNNNTMATYNNQVNEGFSWQESANEGPVVSRLWFLGVPKCDNFSWISNCFGFQYDRKPFIV